MYYALQEVTRCLSPHTSQCSQTTFRLSFFTCKHTQCCANASLYSWNLGDLSATRCTLQQRSWHELQLSSNISAAKHLAQRRMDNCLEQIAHNGWCLPEKVGSLTLTHVVSSLLLLHLLTQCANMAVQIKQHWPYGAGPAPTGRGGSAS